MKSKEEVLVIMNILMGEIDEDKTGLKMIPRIKLEAYADILKKEEIPCEMINKMYWIGMGNIIDSISKR